MANLQTIRVRDDGCFHVSESVIQTSLRGVDSHGINLFPHYHAVAVAGRINKKPSFFHERTGASVAAFDADYTGLCFTILLACRGYLLRPGSKILSAGAETVTLWSMVRVSFGCRVNFQR